MQVKRRLRNVCRRILCCFALGLLVCGNWISAQDAASGVALAVEIGGTQSPRSVSGYIDRSILGWTVRVSDQLLLNGEEDTELALRLMRKQLSEIVEVVPQPALAQLRRVVLWVSPAYEGFRPTAEYHPNSAWLRKQGRLSELVRGVEFSNVEIFERECERMPMMVLHELAHAYHHQVLGFDEPSIMAAYDQALQSGIYDAVRRGNGKIERAYAISNHKEYFAECSEAYFGTNDYFPFERDELKTHDPRMLEVLSQVWKDN